MDSVVRILQVTVGGKDFTGVASFLLQYYGSINKNTVYCDFLFCRENSMSLQSKNPVFANSKMFELNATKDDGDMDYFLLFKKLCYVLRKNHYDIIHINTSSIAVTLCCVFASKICGVKTIISHSHNDGIGMMPKITSMSIKCRVSEFLKSICKIISSKMSDYLFACSNEAGAFLFGEDNIRSPKFYIVKNAIDTEKFAYNVEIRNRIRNSHSIADECLIVGNVGRFSLAKNHDFILDVFKQIHIKNPNSVLWLIGEGEEKSNISTKIKKNEMESYVKLWGERKDVNELLQAIDVFLFPSLHEGLGMVAIEAQAAGVITYVSDAVPDLAKISDLAHSLSLEMSPEEWADSILQTVNSNRNTRRDMTKEIQESGYDIQQAAKWLESMYIAAANN